MKLVQTKNKTTELRQFPGLIDATVEHTIKESCGSAKYLGPKIPPEEWNKVLSFFKWTYDTTKSESQVRFYVNPELGTWKAWAYPQKARMGMTAEEIPCKDADDQRAQFADGWIYFCTVHHHCSAGAFQSGTDEANERSQDGLHITVGDMNQNKHTLHARFYLQSMKFEPDMSEFWSIGDELLLMLPPEVWDRVARYQMTMPSEVAFPDQWKTNLIEIKSLPLPNTGYTGYTPQGHWEGLYSGKDNGKPTYTTLDNRTPWEKELDAARDFLIMAAERKATAEDVRDFFEELDTNCLFEDLVKACDDENTEVGEVVKDWNQLFRQVADDTILTKEEQDAELEAMAQDKKEIESKTDPKLFKNDLATEQYYGGYME